MVLTLHLFKHAPSFVYNIILHMDQHNQMPPVDQCGGFSSILSSFLSLHY